MSIKVLHVLHHSVPGRLDGYAIRSHAILRAQQSAGVHVCALTGSHEVAYADHDNIDGIRYLRTPASSRLKVFGYEQLSRYRDLKKRLRAVITAQRPDVIHVHSPVYNGLAALGVARQAQIPLVYEVRALWEDAAVDQQRFGAGSILYRAASSLESHLLKRADAVVTICCGLRNEVILRGVEPDKIFVAPNGVDTGEFRPMPRDTQLAQALGLKDGLTIGFIGSLFSFEGVEDLLDVIPDTLNTFPNVTFLIAGGGERQAQVLQRAGRLRDTGRLIYTGSVPHHEVRRYYSLLDVVVYPRRCVRLTEVVTPLKPLEAMAMQKTVVASDIGGHRELVRDGETGLLYKAGNRSSLVQILHKVAEDETLRSRLAAAARTYVIEERQWDHIIANHFAAYEKALAAYSRTSELPTSTAMLGNASPD